MRLVLSFFGWGIISTLYHYWFHFGVEHDSELGFISILFFWVCKMAINAYYKTHCDEDTIEVLQSIVKADKEFGALYFSKDGGVYIGELYLGNVYSNLNVAGKEMNDVGTIACEFARKMGSNYYVSAEWSEFRDSKSGEVIPYVKGYSVTTVIPPVVYNESKQPQYRLKFCAFGAIAILLIARFVWLLVKYSGGYFL